LGYSSLEELIGRGDILVEDELMKGKIAKSDSVNVEQFFAGMPDVSQERAWLMNENGNDKATNEVHINGFSSDLDRTIVCDFDKLIEDGEGVLSKAYKIRNTDRSTGAMLAGTIAKKWGNKGFMGKAELEFEGSAGQR
tara:strand:+ start:153 stop:566 length:414 start_codon:yes stop_codon:yes gene_type:complete